MYFDGLDDLDNKIINALLRNARLSYSELGEIVGVSRVSVKNRMEILEKKGIILGYTTLINPTHTPEGIRFFMDVTTDTEHFDEVVDFIASKSIIRRVYAVTGENQFKAEGYAYSRTKYELFMRTLRSEIKNVDGIKQMFVYDAQYTIKDVDGGVDYERTGELQ